MPAWNIIQAVNDALRIEMRRDPRVVVMGEDVGKFGGVFRATLGLIEEFGAERVIDTPLAEAGIIGAAIGMAMYGLRPVPEIQFSDFIFPAFDQIVNELAKLRYRSGGQYGAPVVIRTPVGGGIKGGHYHSQSPEALFIHTPGLQVICPSNPLGRHVPRGAAGGGAAPGARRRAHRPANALAAGHRRRHAQRAQDRPLRHRAGGAAHLRFCGGDQRARPGALLHLLGGPRRPHHRLGHAVPVHAGKRLPAARAADPEGAARAESLRGLTCPSSSSSCRTSAKAWWRARSSNGW